MADWQVQFFLVPRRALAESGALSRAALINTSWWSTHPFPSDYQKRLASVAAAADFTTEHVESWGPEDGNRIDVLSANGRVSRVAVRVDVRLLDSRFGAALLGFVRAAGALLVRTDGLVVEPIISAYAGALRESGAWKFANPAPTPPASNAESDEDND